jgi:hypothetical protein
MGTSEIKFHTSRLGTLVLWIVLVSCFGFLAAVKLRGTVLWAAVSIVVLIVGLLVSRRHAPETEEIAKGDTTGELIEYLERTRAKSVHLFFRRGAEPKFGMDERAAGLECLEYGVHERNSAYITFYSPRAGTSPKVAANHFQIPLARLSLFQEMVALLHLVEDELSARHVVVHIGWPISSWLDRLGIGVWFLNLERLPRMFPAFGFIMRYTTRVPIPSANTAETAKEKREEHLSSLNPSSNNNSR